jgi:hypothetical protein
MGPLLSWYGTAHHVADPWAMYGEDSLQIQSSCRYISRLERPTKNGLPIRRVNVRLRQIFWHLKFKFLCCESLLVNLLSWGNQESALV